MRRNNPSGMVLIKLSLWNKVASVVSTAQRDALSRSSNPRTLLRTLYPFDQLEKLKPAMSPAQLAHIPVELVPAFDEGRLKSTQHELEENDNGKLPSNLRPCSFS